MPKIDTAADSRTTPRRTLAVCCAAHVLHDGLSDVSYVLLPILAQAFNLSLTQVGLIRSAWRAATAMFQTPAGLAAERLGARNLLAFGTAFAGIAFIALGQAAGFTVVLVTLFCAGCGSAFQHPLCSTLISHAYPDAGRRIALGTYNFFGDVGKFAFGGAVSLLFAAGISWQVPISVYGAMALLCAAAILLTLPRTSLSARTETVAALGKRTPPGWGIRNRRGFLTLCAIEVIDGSTRTGLLTFVAFLMIAKSLPAGWAALSVPLILIGGMAGKLACGFLAERVGIVRTIVITEFAAGAGILSLLVLPGVASYFLLPFLGIAVNGTSSVLYATVGDLVDEERLPRAFGLFYTINSVCGLVVPLVVGLIGDAFGVTTSIALVGLLAFLTLPLCVVLKAALRTASA
jgi:FSR family fosmidomycin resistance protein-like MFS transporter